VVRVPHKDIADLPCSLTAAQRILQRIPAGLTA
jgi:hypothetical protein